MLRKNNGYMPDVLDCLANLSNDEVFTPPEVANKMLDLLPQELFESKDTKFLDPFTKSGVFLREITKRLLKNQLPDYEAISSEIDRIEKEAIQEAVRNNELSLNDAYYSEKAKKIGRNAVEAHKRAEEFNLFERKLQRELNRIFSTQVFGIAITELTAQLARRSLYCSKNAAGKYSISTEFDNEDGNIRFKSCQHVWNKKPKWIELDKKWKGGTCIFCGASSENFERPDDLEQHAYEFIHTPNAERIFDMKFDVICGNPPYQMKTAGSVESQATPIYHKFIEQAIRLDPKYLTMIVPARWLNGGFGLDGFRSDMLKQKHIKDMHIYMDSTECFPGVDIAGGICYFLWEKTETEKCKVVNHTDGVLDTAERPLLEKDIDVFIRENKAVSIINKVKAFNEESFDSLVTAADPFGLNYKEGGTVKMFKNFHSDKQDGDVGIYYYGWLQNGLSYVERDKVTANKDAVDKYKVLISKAYGERGSYPYFIIGKPFLAQPQTVCNMSYIMVGSYDNEETANNVMTYMRTKFFRFLVSLLKSTQNAYRKVYKLVPMQDFSKPWTDEELYRKYGITKDEIDFIDSMIRPMDNIDTVDKDGDSDD